MSHKFHARDAAKPSGSRGFSCDEDGVFYGRDCALVRPVTVDGRTVYRARAIEDVNKALSARFGAEVDLSRYLTTLERVAGLMTDGRWGLAEIMILQIRWPALVDDEAEEWLSKAKEFLRFNSKHRPAGR